jgi:hypothetical protein
LAARNRVGAQPVDDADHFHKCEVPAAAGLICDREEPLPHPAGEARLPVWVKNLTNGDVRPESVYPSIVLQNSKNDFQRFSAKRATKR